MEHLIGVNNRISVQWTLLTTEGEPFTLDGYQLIVQAFSGRGRTDIQDVTVSGADSNILSWIMEAKELHYLGNYSLSLALMKDGLRYATVSCRDAFRISSRFEDHCGCTQEVKLSSYVNVIHGVGKGDGINEVMIGEDGPFTPESGSRRVVLPAYPNEESLGINLMQQEINGLDERVMYIEQHGGGSIEWSQIQTSGVQIAILRLGQQSPISVFAPRQVKSVTGRIDYYQAGTSNTVAPTGEWTEEATPSDYGPDKPYLWKKTKTAFTDETYAWTAPALIASWGQIGAPGDETDTVYALADVAQPISVTILDNTPSQDDTFLPTFVFAYSDSTSEQELTTRTLPGISSEHRFRYKAVRKKVNGTWGAFSAPALDANYATASLTQEEIEAIKEDVQTAIEDDLASALNRIGALESEFDDIDSDLGGIHTTIDSQSGRLTALEARTVWTEEGIAHIADVQIDAAEGTIKAWAAEKTEEMFTDAGITIDGVAATVESFADFYDTNGTLSSVHQRLDAAEAFIETAATTADVTGAINSARTEWQTGDSAAITQSVTKARYLIGADNRLVDFDGRPLWYKGSGTSASDRLYKNPADNKYYPDPLFEGEAWTGQVNAAYYPANSAVGLTTVDGMTFIKQNAGEIALVAMQDDPTMAASIVVAAMDSGTVIELNADSLSFKGTGTFEDPVYFLEDVWFDTCHMVEGTIDEATITNCTIISDIKSAGYDTTGEGFYLNAETGEIIATKFGESNDKGFTIAGGHIESYQHNGTHYPVDYNPIDIDADGSIRVKRLVGDPGQTKEILLDTTYGLQVTSLPVNIIGGGSLSVNGQDVVTSPDGALKIDIVTSYPSTLANNTIYIKVQ